MPASKGTYDSNSGIQGEFSNSKYLADFDYDVAEKEQLHFPAIALVAEPRKPKAREEGDIYEPATNCGLFPFGA